MIDTITHPFTIFLFLALITSTTYYFKRNTFLKVTCYSFLAVLLTIFLFWIIFLIWEKFIGSTGFAAFVLLYPAVFLTFPLWIMFCRRKLGLSWKMTSLAALMPFLLFTLTFELSDFLHTLDQPRREREVQIFYAESELRRIKEYLQKYKEKCGSYPENLSGILKANSCWKEEDFTSINYRDGAFLIDPWGKPFLYEKSFLKTLGRDNRIGGEDVDQDRSIQL